MTMGKAHSVVLASFQHAMLLWPQAYPTRDALWQEARDEWAVRTLSPSLLQEPENSDKPVKE